MRRASRAFALAFGIGILLLLCIGALERRTEAFTLGVEPTGPASLPRGEEICQRPIEVSAGFSRIYLEPGSERGPAAAFDVRVRRLPSGRQLAEGGFPGGYEGRRTAVITVGDVRAGSRISVCIRNAGVRPLQVYGSSGLSNPSSAAHYRGEAIDFDLALVFLRSDDASLLSLTNDIIARASLFRGAWVGAWAGWLILALLLTAFPLLLFRALRDVER